MRTMARDRGVGIMYWVNFHRILVSPPVYAGKVAAFTMYCGDVTMVE